ncbi:MAG: cob(I)yrinic acid a,c-diamide adenosyltransferase [Candidatus Micrarchaeota archaeon]|nr:cob(I)yrinic acid a,c-diamide adenosyltransferase [Candidatus Micrarchaeota archaeon]
MKSIALTGDSKGKTTSSIAITINEIRKGNKVLFLQYLKGGRFSGEIHYLIKHYNDQIKILQYGKVSIFSEEINAGKRSPGMECFTEVKGYKKSLMRYSIEKTLELIQSGLFNVLVLDESITAYWLKKLSLKHIKEFKDRADINKYSLFLCTGRGLDHKLSKLFDEVYFFNQIKHPYHDINLAGRYGIEY